MAETTHSHAGPTGQPLAQDTHAGEDLNRLAATATNHCLTGCVIGEVTGMVLATTLGWGGVASIVIAIALAFAFGYTLTAFPLIRSGLAISTVVAIALAADTLSMAVMELVDNGTMLVVPGALGAGLGEILFWAPLLGGFALAWPVAFAVNKALIRRGKGHAAAHAFHAH
jgi:hypothetical protein